jgi:hypothetical protein
MSNIKIHIDVKYATESLRRNFSRLTQKEFSKGVRLALNETIVFGNSQMKKEIVKVYNLKPSSFKAGVFIKKAQIGNLEATISISGKKLNLRHFNPRQTQKGVTYEIIKGKRVLFPHGFIIKSKNQGLPLVMARGQYSPSGFQFRKHRISASGRNDLPIQKIAGISIPQTFAKDNQETVRSVYAKLNQEYPKRLTRILTNIAEGSIKTFSKR